MKNRLYKGIAAGLKAVKNCTIYVEKCPQNFKSPSFLITIYQQEAAGGINGRLKKYVSMDVLYFPKSKSEAYEECWQVEQGMSRSFRIQDFKIKNRNSKIEDDVLHYMFDVNYREYLPDDTPNMQRITQNEEIKEG